MVSMGFLIKSLVLLITLQLSTETSAAHGLTTLNDRKTYIVYMGDVPKIDLSPEEHHHSILTHVVGDEALARESRIHSYGKSLYGFAAQLLPNEAAKLREREDVVSVFLSGERKLVTTRSWDFLGFTEKNAKRNLDVESNTIVALIDSGIEIGAPSFDDKGYGPVPAKWKGKCEIAANFSGCNRKVVGASWYNVGGIDSWMEPTPYDNEGHGSHTSSTAAGNSVHGASLYGVGKGTARGAVPRARIAMYKVCGALGCFDANVLAAFDTAIADGVDVISVSLGGPTRNFMEDAMSIGSFHAMKNGILTVAAAGNGVSPLQGSVTNTAPWMFTATATNTDRRFVTRVKLGNGEFIDGISINTFIPPNQMTPLILGSQAQDPSKSDNNATICDSEGMMLDKVKGKIVLCFDNYVADEDLQMVGAAGMVGAVANQIDYLNPTFIPASLVTYDAAARIERYINSTKNPTAMIYRTIDPKTNINSPTVAAYALRGPALLARHILKPDIAAPGTDILAAWSKQPSLTGSSSDPRHSYFNIVSGTSMATPHVAGAVAYVKTFHPDWSPAAIKSALMTTARPVNGDGTENPLNSGAGLIDPLRAVHPGLVYDMGVSDYFPYLCNEGYNTTTISLISGKGSPKVSCSDYLPAPGSDGINNYPSMHLFCEVEQRTASAVFYRTVTYVGCEDPVFRATVIAPKEMSVKVTPTRLWFKRRHQMKSFKVEANATFTENKSNYLIAYVVWSNAKYFVKSPIVIYRPQV